MRLGLFLCTCNDTVDIDLRAVKKSIKKDVAVVETHDQLCQGGLDYIIDDLRRLELDGILIGACTEKKRIFERVAAGFGCDTFFLNLREHCGWVHGRKEATEKAKSMIEAALSSAEAIHARPKLEKIALDAGYTVLVVGDEAQGAFAVAKSLSRLARVHLVTDTVHEWCDDPEIHIGSLKAIRGEIGNFEVEIERDIERAKCISCGLCADACPLNAIRYDAVYTIGTECDACGACIEVCPTGAIALHTPEVIRAGQILVIDKEWLGSNQFGIYKADDYEDALRKALEISSQVGELEKERYLALELKRCASGRSELLGCEYCLPCPYGAIRREGIKMVFSDVGCLGCGLCTSLCPVSVPQLRGYPNELLYAQIETLLAGDLEPKVLLVACTEHLETLNAVGRKKIRYPAVLPLFVPCIDMVSEAHLLSAFDHGADGVILWGCDQSQREHLESKPLQGFRGQRGGAPLMVHFVQMALAAFNLGERVLLMDHDQVDASEVANTITNFVKGLRPSPIRKKKVAPVDRTRPQREILVEAIQNLYTKTKVQPRLKEENTPFPFADIVINARCTLCNACVNLCPTKALGKEVNAIEFSYRHCIACGLCEQACPEDALKLRRVLDFSRLVERKSMKLIEAELMACARCGKLFMPRSAFERMTALIKEGGGEGELTLEERLEMLSYCEKCRPVRAIELSLHKVEHEK
ncbi:MAG: 4Fe-4S dicluster domain-containing protein [Methanophagales archaeon ANME-1-THS]|nr:MAG: 4Fe-4S dicluster domain-containing protein [Methanophagales archaeon ANME-1-THS]